MDTPLAAHAIDTLLQRLNSSDASDASTDLLRTVSNLSQCHAPLPRPPQDVLLPILQHTRSVLAANQGTPTPPIGLLVQAATQLLLHHCPPLQPPAPPSTSTGLVMEVVEATPLDQLPHHLIAVAAATAPHPALEPCVTQVVAATTGRH